MVSIYLDTKCIHTNIYIYIYVTIYIYNISPRAKEPKKFQAYTLWQVNIIHILNR